MGGRALAGLGVERVTTARLISLWAEIQYRLSSIGITEAWLVPSYTNKETHGDIDVLVPDDPTSVDELRQVFSSRLVLVNGPVVTLDYENVQVDLIKTNRSHWAASQAFYSYNDRGNLVGAIFRNLGMKYTHRGLYWPLTVGTNQLTNSLISTDPDEIHELIGLKLTSHDTLESIFHWVAGSQYFDPEICQMSRRRSVDRVRDQKRPTYQAFLQWIEKTRPPPGPGTPDQFHQMICHRFPSIITERQTLCDQYQARLAQRDQIRNLISWERLAAVIDITGPEMSGFVQYIRDQPQSVLSNDAEIVRLYGEFTNEKN